MKHAMKKLLSVMLACSPLLAGPRDAEWKKVEDYMNKDLPKSAITELAAIDAKARAEKAWPEAIRATAQRVKLEGTIEEGADVIGPIKRLEKELEAAPEEMKPLLQTIDALWLWSYFTQNQWQFMQRTQTAQQPGDDIQTWDLQRILAEIDSRFMKALANRDALKAQPVDGFSMLLEKGTTPDELRPTMYDFLVHEILNFYAAEESVDAAAEDAFEFDAASPACGTASCQCCAAPKRRRWRAPAHRAATRWCRTPTAWATGASAGSAGTTRRSPTTATTRTRCTAWAGCGRGWSSRSATTPTMPTP
jgi:hypothetical protein